MKGPVKGFRGHLVTLLVAVGTMGALWVFFLGMGGGLPSGDAYRIKAVVPTASSLAPGARVTMAGVGVGRVTSVERRGLGAVIDMALTDRRVTPIPRDSRVQVRLRTAAGENYVAITPGRSREAASSGTVLAASQADELVEVDRLLSVLQGGTRERARQMIRGLGEGLRGEGDELNALVRGGAGAFTRGSRVVRILARDREQVSRLVDQLGNVAGAIGDRGAAIRTLARRGLTTFETLAQRDTDLRRLLDELPPTLTQVRKTTTTLGTVSDTAAPVVSSVSSALRELTPALRLLQPAAEEGRGVVSELGSAAPRLERTLTGLRSLSTPAADALPELGKTLCQVNPMLEYIEPYTPDVIQFVVGLASATNSYDAQGHLIRLTPIVSENSLVGLPPEVSRAAHALIHAGLLGKVNGLNWNPYPAPGQIGKTNAAGKAIHGPAELAKSGFKYPRILPDC